MIRLSWGPGMKHTVESVMTAEVVAIRPSSPFRDLVRLLQQHRISALPVVDDAGRPVGIVSEADLLVKEGYPHGAEDAGMVDAIRYRRRLGKAAGATAAEVMAAPVITVAVDTSVVEAARLMVCQGVKRLPVVDEQGRLAGVVTRSDLLKVFLRPDPAIGWEVEHDVIHDRCGHGRHGELQSEAAAIALLAAGRHGPSANPAKSSAAGPARAHRCAPASRAEGPGEWGSLGH